MELLSNVEDAFDTRVWGIAIYIMCTIESKNEHTQCTIEYTDCTVLCPVLLFLFWTMKFYVVYVINFLAFTRLCFTGTTPML